MSENMSDDFSEPTPESNRNMIILIAAVVALCICGAIAILLLVVRPFETDPTPTPTTPSGPESGVDPVWSNILASGKLIVGTSADYPPFEYYTDNFQLDGFDIALIRDIGQKLNLAVEIKDMAFDGLGGALQINQIDVAISAITITPERDGFIDFSNTYVLSEDALLAAPGSQIRINVADEIGAYRLGVQSGSIYENFARSELIETGKMAANNLFVYPQMDKAIDDLAAGRIDIVALDSGPASVAVQEGGFVIAGVGLNRQQLAMGIPQDSFMLQAQLNQALSELQAEGRLAALANQYLGLDPGEIPPLPTPVPGQPTPTPFPPSGCIDAMQWVADLSYDDGDLKNITELPPGTPFQKGWRVRNTGTCTWDSSYSLVPVGGNSPAARMGGLPTPVQGQVAPGQTYEFWVNLIAPLDPGTYVEYWTLRNPNGILFGDRIWVAITVPAVATPTPLPTQTPSPSISFSANPESIQQGECSTLTWSTSNVQAVYLYPQGEPWQNYGVPGEGSRVVCPIETTTYDLRVVKNDGSVEIRTVTIHVIPNASAPVISRFTVEPPYEITLGQCVQITWIVQGAVDTVNLSRNGIVIWPNAPFSGSTPDCPAATGEYNYGIEATGPGGTSRMQHYIRVTSPAPTATPPPEATATSPPAATARPTGLPPTPTPITDPIIYSFSVTPNQVATGQCVNVAWSVGGNTSQIQILKNNMVVLDNAAFRDSVPDCDLQTAGIVTYGIQATNDAGGSATDQAQVTVVESAPDNPLAGTQWQLEIYTIGEVATPLTEQQPVISLDFEASGQYAGFSGCNTYGGTYTVNSSQIALTEPKTTKKSCDPTINQLEATYWSLLPTFTTYQITPEGKLILTDATEETIFTYEPLILATPF